MNQALMTAAFLVKQGLEIIALVNQAMGEGRDLTIDELNAVRQRRDDADQAFLAELQRRQGDSQ